MGPERLDPVRITSRMGDNRVFWEKEYQARRNFLKSYVIDIFKSASRLVVYGRLKPMTIQGSATSNQVALENKPIVVPEYSRNIRLL